MLEIGLLLCAVLMSVPGVLRRGVIIAVFNSAGTTPVCSDMLHRSAKNGDCRSLHSLSSRVGIGSNQDCLFGASSINFMISATVTGLKAEKLTTFSSTSWYWVGGAHCVLHRTSSTFYVKKAEKSSGVRNVGLFSLPRHRTALIVCQ